MEFSLFPKRGYISKENPYPRGDTLFQIFFGIPKPLPDFPHFLQTCWNQPQQPDRPARIPNNMPANGAEIADGYELESNK
jgi:hypothetical protein